MDGWRGAARGKRAEWSSAFRRVVVLALGGLGLAAPGVAQLAGDSLRADTVRAVEASARAAAPPGIADLELLGRSALHALTTPARWDSGEWLLLPVAGAGLVALTILDDDGRDLMRRNQTEGLTEFTTDFERLGTIDNFGLLAGFYAAGLIFDDAKARSVAVEGLASALIAAGLITPTLQWVTGRSRPRASDDPYTLDAFSRNISFPSGHTTHAFAVASVIATEYDALWVKAAAYGLASAVGLCRMYDDAHYLSDVTAAALIGTLVGRSVARFGQKRRGALEVRPLLTPGAAGAGLTVRF
jgi:membrane-associated phospholipid phosphatase